MVKERGAIRKKPGGEPLKGKDRILGFSHGPMQQERPWKETNGEDLWKAHFPEGEMEIGDTNTLDGRWHCVKRWNKAAESGINLKIWIQSDWNSLVSSSVTGFRPKNVRNRSSCVRVQSSTERWIRNVFVMSSHHLLHMLKVIAQEQATCTSYKTADHRDELEKSGWFCKDICWFCKVFYD